MAVHRGGDDRGYSSAAPRSGSPKGRAVAAISPELDPQADLSGFRSRPDDDGLALEGLAASDLERAGENPYELQAAGEIGTDQDQVSATGAAECPLTPRSIVEAILFVGHPNSEGISSRYLAALMRGVRPAEIDVIVQELNEEYARLGCPYSIASVASGYRLVLRDEFLNLKESFYGKVREAKLSQAAIDVLAVVAYHQPISRESILQFCDTATPALLAQLVRRGLLAVERTGPGPTGWTYSTSERFLQMFGLRSLNDLPRAQGEE